MEVPDGKLLDLDSITSSQLAKHVRYVMCGIVCVCVYTLCVNVCVCVLCVRVVCVYIHMYVYVYLYVCTCMCVCMCVCTCIIHVYILSQLTVVELSLFKAVDLYEMTVHLWEGNTPGRTC